MPPQRGAYLHTGPEELYARYGFRSSRSSAAAGVQGAPNWMPCALELYVQERHALQ
jgi:hypothetical protein